MLAYASGCSWRPDGIISGVATNAIPSQVRRYAGLANNSISGLASDSTSGLAETSLRRLPMPCPPSLGRSDAVHAAASLTVNYDVNTGKKHITCDTRCS